jgi:hypothetical protein
MSQVQLGTGTLSDLYEVFYNGRGLFHLTLAPSFHPGLAHTLSEQQWKSVAVETSQGVVIFEMQDRNWIFRHVAYPPNALDGRILQVATFGTGRIPSLESEIINGQRLQYPLRQLLDGHQDQVTIYLDNLWNGLYFQGSNGRYYNEHGQDDRTVITSESQFFQVPIDNTWTYYLVHLERGRAIGAFDRFGDLQFEDFLQTTREDASVTGFRQIVIPLSLQVSNGNITMSPRIPNYSATNRLDGIIGTSWENLSHYPDYHLYFVEGLLEAYLRNNTSEFARETEYLRVSDRTPLSSEQIPGGFLRYMGFGVPVPEQAILHINDGMAIIYYVYENRDIEPDDSLELILPPELQHQTRVWNLVGPDNGPLIRLFRSPSFDPNDFQAYILVNGEFVRENRNFPRSTRPAPLRARQEEIPGHGIPEWNPRSRSGSPELFGPLGIQTNFVPPPLQRARPLGSPTRSPQMVRQQTVAPLFRENPPEQPTIRQIDIFNRQSLERFLSWYYPNPLGNVIEPDLLEGYTRAGLPEISQLLSSGQVARFESPPVMQPWAGPPGTPNRIFTFQTLDGRKLFVKAQYNQQINQLLPPV